MTSELDSVTLAADDAPPREDDDAHPIGRGSQLGRYVVLGRIGGGGMGVVHAAYDPDLDRKVALKLLRSFPGRSRAGQARTRLLREAQALAKLSHPNVVAVYDVDTVGERVWIAMEFVDGPTLSGWARERARRWPEILDVMLPAARGLAVAHAAGILHRDLKPDNVMIGSDGRVRVTDFGLARLHGEHEQDEHSTDELGSQPSMLAMHVTQIGAVLGTPAYMSPEQLLGRPVDAKSDQFSFCVTLWELLYGDRPFPGDTLVERTSAALEGRLRAPATGREVPAWLRRACERGLSEAPERRFEGMDALIAALERGRSQVRKRPVLLGLGGVLVLGLGVLGERHLAEARRVAECEAIGASIEEVWNDEARTRLRDEVLATELSYAPATVEQATQRLDALAEGWREHAAAACLEVGGAAPLDRATSERAQWCLQERRLELASVIEELREPDAKLVQRAVPLVMGLLESARCRDAELLASQPAPPTGAERDAVVALRSELAGVSALAWAGRSDAALAPARDVAARAEVLGWPPLLAAAKHAEASVLIAAGRYAEAEAAALESYRQAASVEAWSGAASAAEQLVTVVGYHLARPAEGRVWAVQAEVAAGLEGDPLRHHEATRTANLGIVEFIAGDHPRARALFERALELHVDAFGPQHLKVATSLNSLANAHYAEGDYAGAIRLNRRALAIRETVLGSEHPEVAASLGNLSVFLHMSGQSDEALAMQERALAIRRAAFGSVHPEVGNSLANLGALHLELRNDAAAEQVLIEAARVLEATLGPEDIQLATALVMLGQIELETGRLERAAPRLERALTIQEARLGPEHGDVSGALHQLGRLHAVRGEHAKARGMLERALVIRERSLPPTHLHLAETCYELGRSLVALGETAAAMPRLEHAIEIVDANPDVPSIARFARFVLAKVLVDGSGGDRARALALAEQASAAFAGAGDAELRAEIDAWLAEQRRAGEDDEGGSPKADAIAGR